jgi:hypothetical protein
MRTNPSTGRGKATVALRRDPDGKRAGTRDAAGMSMTFDVAAVAHELDRLAANPHIHKLALVLPLDLGKRDVARAYLDEGPPFDLTAAGIDAHEVFLTDEEAIFVFGVPDGPQTLERILADEDFWSVVASWEHIAAGPPRVARVAYDWRAGA